MPALCIAVVVILGIARAQQPTSFNFDHIRYTFYPGEIARTWTEANVFCKSLGKELAVFANRGQIRNVSEYLSPEGGVWTGYKTNGDGRFESVELAEFEWKKEFGTPLLSKSKPKMCGLLSVANYTGIVANDCSVKKAALCSLSNPDAIEAETIRDAHGKAESKSAEAKPAAQTTKVSLGTKENNSTAAKAPTSSPKAALPTATKTPTSLPKAAATAASKPDNEMEGVDTSADPKPKNVKAATPAPTPKATTSTLAPPKSTPKPASDDKKPESDDKELESDRDEKKQTRDDNKPANYEKKPAGGEKKAGSDDKKADSDDKKAGSDDKKEGSGDKKGSDDKKASKPKSDEKSATDAKSKPAESKPKTAAKAKKSDEEAGSDDEKTPAPTTRPPTNQTPVQIESEGGRFTFFPNHIMFGGYMEYSRFCEDKGLQPAVFTSRSQLEDIASHVNSVVMVWTGYSTDSQGIMHSVDEAHGQWQPEFEIAGAGASQSLMCGALSTAANKVGITLNSCASAHEALCSAKTYAKKNSKK